MIDRKEFAEEIILRESVRKAIRVVTSRRTKKSLMEIADEATLRSMIRVMVAESQAPVADQAKHDSTGINVLEDLLKNTNLLSVVETGYKSLTTRDEDDPPEGPTKQRLSFMNHILNAVEKSLAPEESRKGAGEDVEITEEVDITIADDPTDDPDFIDVEDKEEVEVDEREDFGINGEDKTGRNRAFTDFKDIEKNILTAFDDLDNPQDIALFEEYLIKNLVLYFEKWEAELVNKSEPPALAADAEADEPAAAAPADDEADPETGMPDFERQESANLFDIDDILKNIL
jgi:hypothetical protein